MKDVYGRLLVLSGLVVFSVTALHAARLTIFIDGDTCGCGLSRPEGITFGPNGKLYVTSFRKGALDPAGLAE
jgi:hypothetical protein